MAEKFHDNDAGVERMIAAGQMKQTMIEGVPFCTIRRMKIGTMAGTEKKIEIEKARVGQIIDVIKPLFLELVQRVEYTCNS